MERIKTERLVLRPFRESDYEDLYEFLSRQYNHEICRLVVVAPPPAAERCDCPRLCGGA